LLADRPGDDDLTLERHLGGGGSGHGRSSPAFPVRMVNTRRSDHVVHAGVTASGHPGSMTDRP
jgi:hypothetical protein